MYSLPKGLVFRAIEEDRPPLSDTASELQRSRFVCYRCTREVHGLVICDGPICSRCTGVANVQEVLNAGQKIPEPQTAEERRLTAMMARHHAQHHFQLPKRKPEEKEKP